MCNLACPIIICMYILSSIPSLFVYTFCPELNKSLPLPKSLDEVGCSLVLDCCLTGEWQSCQSPNYCNAGARVNEMCGGRCATTAANGR
jgi:hypothetical protein